MRVFVKGKRKKYIHEIHKKGNRQKTEDRRQKTEDRRQKTEDRRQKTEDRYRIKQLIIKSFCGCYTRPGGQEKDNDEL
jgi:replication initiation and membrane attachment protein DnaB